MLKSSSARSVSVRVFYSLLIISVLETLVWSFCLFGAGDASTAAQAYYSRETVNLKSATGGAPDHAGVGAVRLAVDNARTLDLALKEEQRVQQQTLSAFLSQSSHLLTQLPAPLTAFAVPLFTFQPDNCEGSSGSSDEAATANAGSVVVV